jgi:two-component system phosphate regulon sensor histidine kinase PhoR
MDLFLRAILAALLVLVALLAAALVTRRRRALAQMVRSLHSLENDRPTRAASDRFVGELGGFAREFNRVISRLEKRLGQLRGDRRLLETVLEGMTEGVLAVDARRRLLFSNRAARALFGLPEGAGGRLVAELVRRPQIQAAIEAGLQQSGPYQAEIHVETSGPSRGRQDVLSLSVQSTPLQGADSPGTIFVFHDVTELRRLERMRQDFVANASHEFKTPLASIRAYAETLLEGAIHDESVNLQFLQRIQEQADRLNELVLDMLSLARLDAGQDTFDHAPIAVDAVVHGCVETHRGRAEAKGLTLVERLEGLDASVQVVAAEEALRQIIDNLIDNAIKYTPEGGRIRVQARAKDRIIVIEVADTGIGIPRNELGRVFERFYRVDRARSRSVGGTGLGLAIVKNLVQSLGGQVRVESRVNAGSVFSVSLPRYETRKSHSVAEKPAAAASGLS